MARRYFNTEAYELVQGDTLPAYIFSIYSNGEPADFSSYGSLVVTARFREKGATTSLAEIVCDEVNASVGQFKITLWPAAVSAAEEGKHELEIEVDYLGDGTQVQTVTDLVLFKVLEQFGDEA